VRSLKAELELLQERIDVTRDTRDPGSCGDVERKSYPAIDDILSRLPNDTDPDKLNALRDSVRRLRELADQECSLLAEEIRQEREQDQPEETVETAPPAVTTEATPPETTPTESTPEATAPETTPAPGNSGNEQGNGGGRGTGNGVTPPGQGGGLPAPDPDEDD